MQNRYKESVGVFFLTSAESPEADNAERNKNRLGRVSNRLVIAHKQYGRRMSSRVSC